MAHQVKSPENQPQFSQTTMGQYWLCKTKPKTSFQIDPKCFQKVATEFDFFNIFQLLTTDCLPA